MNDHTATSSLGEVRTASSSISASYDKMFKSKSLDDLVQDIVFLHHDFLRETLPVLSRQLNRVVTVYGSRYPELLESHMVFLNLAHDLKEHVEKEEDFLFPCIQRFDKSPDAVSHGSLKRMIDQVSSEHVKFQRGFSEIRRLLNGYIAPEEVCKTYKAVLQGFDDVESDTHQHRYIETHVLFPKVLQQ